MSMVFNTHFKVPKPLKNFCANAIFQAGIKSQTHSLFILATVNFQAEKTSARETHTSTFTLKLMPTGLLVCDSLY